MLLPGLEPLRKARCLFLLAYDPCWMYFKLSSTLVGQRCCLRPREDVPASFRVKQESYIWGFHAAVTRFSICNDRPNFCSDSMCGKARTISCAPCDIQRATVPDVDAQST